MIYYLRPLWFEYYGNIVNLINKHSVYDPNLNSQSEMILNTRHKDLIFMTREIFIYLKMWFFFNELGLNIPFQTNS